MWSPSFHARRGNGSRITRSAASGKTTGAAALSSGAGESGWPPCCSSRACPAGGWWRWLSCSAAPGCWFSTRISTTFVFIPAVLAPCSATCSGACASLWIANSTRGAPRTPSCGACATRAPLAAPWPTGPLLPRQGWRGCWPGSCLCSAPGSRLNTAGVVSASCCTAPSGVPWTNWKPRSGITSAIPAARSSPLRPSRVAP